MIPYTALTHDHLSTAWRFVEECEDDTPNAYGVDQFPAYASRRYGVFRQRQSVVSEYDWLDRRGERFEDELIARLDGEVEVEAEPNDRLAVEDDDRDEVECEPAVVEDDAPADPSEALSTRLGCGRAAAARERVVEVIRAVARR